MHILLLGLAAAAGVYGLYRFFLRANASQVKAFASTAAFLILAAALFYLAITGRLPAALGLVLALLPFSGEIFKALRHRGAKTATSATMDRSQALEILGLEEGANDDEIKAAHRALLKKLHPDHPGGSTPLTAQLNQAKDILLKNKG